MHKLFRIFYYPLLLIGLIVARQVPAIDGDYVNPYDTGPGAGRSNQIQVNPVWSGDPVYGGKDKELPVMTVVGSGFLVLGIGTAAFWLARERRRRLTSKAEG